MIRPSAGSSRQPPLCAGVTATDVRTADVPGRDRLAASGLAPEVVALLRLVHPDGSAVTAADLPADLDWTQLVRIAGANGLGPLLARRLAALTAADPTRAAASIPTDATDRLSAWTRESAFRGLRLSASLVDLHARLTAAGVRVLPYKGPTLAVRAFGDVALREFSDLDLLVDRADLPAAVDCLTSLGYERHTETPLSPAEIAAGRGVVRPPSEFLFEHPTDGTRVELRWWLGSAVRRVRIPFEEL